MSDFQQPNDSNMSGDSCKCLHCGALLNRDELFCTRCGTPKGEEKTEACAKCGEKLKFGQKFCPKCGEKKDWTIGTKMDHGARQAKSALKHAWKCLAVSALVILFVVGTVLFVDKSKMLVSVEELCAEGDYVKAYKKADGAQKEKIWMENSAAVLFGDIAYSAGGVLRH